VLSDGRIAYAIGDFSTGDLDVMTSIYSIAAPNDFNGNGISDTRRRYDGRSELA